MSKLRTKYLVFAEDGRSNLLPVDDIYSVSITQKKIHPIRGGSFFARHAADLQISCFSSITPCEMEKSCYTGR